MNMTVDAHIKCSSLIVGAHNVGVHAVITRAKSARACSSACQSLCRIGACWRLEVGCSAPPTAPGRAPRHSPSPFHTPTYTHAHAHVKKKKSFERARPSTTPAPLGRRGASGPSAARSPSLSLKHVPLVPPRLDVHHAKCGRLNCREHEGNQPERERHDDDAQLMPKPHRIRLSFATPSLCWLRKPGRRANSKRERDRKREGLALSRTQRGPTRKFLVRGRHKQRERAIEIEIYI